MRKFFKAIKRFLALLPVSLFLTFAILIAAMWFLRPLLDFLQGSIFWIISGVLTTLWVVITGWWGWRRRNRNRKMVEEIAPEPDPNEVTANNEQADLQKKFSSAMQSLSKLRFKSKTGGTRYLYELPWYIFIGPPGAGKTEALRNCGLEFPLRRDDDDDISINGGAGTKDCDWVFTNDAVFIDTAGRYTSQSSNETVDAAAWGNFLDLLKTFRPREPINGVIVAISLSELANASNDDIDAHAIAIRDRLDELCTRMKAQIPVYVMFTKADLLVGFNEFFQSLRPQERAQVWGRTFELGDINDIDGSIRTGLEGIEDDIGGLVGQLGEMQFQRLREEADLGARSRIFGFSAQFASLKPVLARFLRRTFEPNNYSSPMMLRGFYFSSATQIGQPVDRLIASMSREFGLESNIVATLGRGTGRSYFLPNLLTNVIFPEQGLVTKTLRQGLPITRYAGVAAAILLPLVFAGGLFAVYQHNEAQAASFASAVEDFRAEAEDIPLNPVDDHDFKSVLPALNLLDAERKRLRSDDASAPFFGLGVDDTNVLASRADRAYNKANNELLRTRLMHWYERKIDQNLHRPGPLYSILKTYLMIAGAGPLNAEYVKNQLEIEFAPLYPGVTGATTLADLDNHVDAMLEQEFLQPRELNNEAVALARTAVSEITIAERALRSIENDPEALALQPWRATDANRGGLSAKNVFVRTSGQPLDDPIPGLYTYDGFWGFFLSRSGLAAREASKETWLLLSDEEARILALFSANNSPMKKILESAAVETDLGKVPGEDSPMFAVLKSIGLQKLASTGGGGRILAAGARNTNSGPGGAVSDAFLELRQFVDGRDSETLMIAVRDFYLRVSRMADGGEALTLVSRTEEAQTIVGEARRAPNYVADIITEMVAQLNVASSAGVRARIANIWTTTVYPVCRERLHGRYPFGTGGDVAMGDLTTILGPTGTLQKFFKDELARYVDTAVSPWRWRPGVGTTLGIDPGRLTFFENAARISEAFFPNESPDPRVSIAIYRIKLDPGVGLMRFAVSGAAATFTNDPEAQPSQVLWPGAQPSSGVTATLGLDGLVGTEGDSALEELTEGKEGLWGLFRYAQSEAIAMRGSGDRGRLRVAMGGRAATIELRMDSSVNPFALREEIAAFRCPASL